MRKDKEKLVVFGIFGLISLIIIAGHGFAGDFVSELSSSQEWQERPPIADGGRDIVTYVSVKTLFRGYGSSDTDYIAKYEWDFDGDGEYDWESSEKGITFHVYDVPGTYDAIFRVTDSLGNFSIDIIKVIVREGEGEQSVFEKMVTKPSRVQELGVASDGITARYVIMINGGSEGRFWDDVAFMYSTLTNDYHFPPESIYVFNHDGTDPSGENPNNIIDYPAKKSHIDDVFNELGSIIDDDDELFVWVTDHGRGYLGLEARGGKLYGYLGGHASVDPGDEEDYLESEFKLRSFFTVGDYMCNHGMEVWKVYKLYYLGNYRMWRNKFVSHFTEVYFEDSGEVRSDSDYFIERFVDYLEGDYNHDGIIETSKGEVFDYDGDGVPPYDPDNDSFDEDDWGFIDHCDDDLTHINTQVPGDRYMIFDANLDNHVDIDINHDINNLEVDGTDLDNQGLFDGIDVNDDGDMADWVSIDELICLYGKDLSDDELATFLDRINARVISIFMEPCHSGGFVGDLSSPNRVISTATTEENYSWGNLFVRNFTSAFHKADPWGTPVDADYDGNGFISMQEAFNYAAFNDYYDEIPQYDDNGDGISHPYPIPNGGDGYLGANVYLTDVVVLFTEVSLDIKPGSCPNPLNVRSKGVLPVAILGTNDFDVTQVDPASVRLVGVAPLRWALEDVATPFEPFVGKEDCLDCTDAGPDSILDLTLKFKTQEVVAAIGPVTKGECLVLELTGVLLDGTPIEGEDVVIIRGCLIATAAYGSRMAKEVNTLEKFRDEYLLTNELGRTFASAYYKYSPSLADCIAKHPMMRKIVRIWLYPILELSKCLVGENDSKQPSKKTE